MNPSWTVRVGRTPQGIARIRTRSHGVDVGQSLDFGSQKPGASSVELLLGALGSDVVLCFSNLCHRKRVDLDQIEAKIDGSLGNALVCLGVVGEEGDPSLVSISITLTVASPAQPDQLNAVWQAVLATAPVLATLRNACSLSCELKLV